jgi:chromosome segregation ATPase
VTQFRHIACTGLALSGIVMVLAGCSGGCGAAASRGFFSGLGAALSGCDQAQANAMEKQATEEEAKAANATAHNTQATLEAQRTAEELREARARVEKVNSDLKLQRAELDRLRRSRQDSSSQLDELLDQQGSLERRANQMRSLPVPPSTADLRVLESDQQRIFEDIQRLSGT